MTNDKEKERQHMRDVHDLEQSSTFVIDNFPRLWYGLYRRCVEEGFNEAQAMALVKVYINTTLGIGRYLGEVDD